MNQKTYFAEQHWRSTLQLLLANLHNNDEQYQRVEDAENDLGEGNIEYPEYRKVLFSALLNSSPEIMENAGDNGFTHQRKVMVTMVSSELLPATYWSPDDCKVYGKYYADFFRVVYSVTQQDLPTTKLGETTMSVFKRIEQAEKDVVQMKKDVTTEQVFDEIVALESERARLDSITNKPKAIVAKIAEIDAKIKEIVAFSDARETKAEATA